MKYVGQTAPLYSFGYDARKTIGDAQMINDCDYTVPEPEKYKFRKQ